MNQKEQRSGYKSDNNSNGLMDLGNIAHKNG
jgi:hypothetical protein